MCRTGCDDRYGVTAQRHTVAMDDDGDDRESEGASRPHELELRVFASLQRSLAAINFPAIQAALRVLDGVGLTYLAETQKAIAKSFAHSIDFAAVADAHQKILALPPSLLEDLHSQWAKDLGRSIDFSAVSDAFRQTSDLQVFLRDATGFQELFQEQTEFLARISEQVAKSLPKIDISRLRIALDRWIPTNLRDVNRLDEVAAISVEEGIPLSWVPRCEIVINLLDAPDASTRLEILVERQAAILDDCTNALLPIDHEWAHECREAADALRAGFRGPAQSHASNIIDSIVLDFHGRDGRQHVKDRASETLEDMSLHFFAENLSLRPLFLAYSPWFPDGGVPPPKHFARHATAHAVGHAGVFNSSSSLVAVMLAASLTVQYSSSAGNWNESRLD